MWTDIRDRLRDGQKVLLVMVGEAGRHSPGTAGACLWIASDGTTQGTVGGGVMELRILQNAEGILASDEPFFEIRELHHRRVSADELDVEPSGMICAGRQVNVTYLLRPGVDLPRVEELSVADRGSGGGWRLDGDGLRLVPGPLPPGARLRDVDGVVVLEQGFAAPYPLAVLGAGHCGRALAELAMDLGYGPILWDTRPRILEALERDGFQIRYVDDFADAGEQIPDPGRTPAVVMTPDVPNDVKALSGALRRGLPFLGAMGSPAKLDEIFRRLRTLRFTSRELSSITAPVGLPIGSRTPREIAVSVMAQLIALRSSSEPGASIRAHDIEGEESRFVDQDTSRGS